MLEDAKRGRVLYIAQGAVLRPAVMAITLPRVDWPKHVLSFFLSSKSCRISPAPTKWKPSMGDSVPESRLGQVGTLEAPT